MTDKRQMVERDKSKYDRRMKRIISRPSGSRIQNHTYFSMDIGGNISKQESVSMYKNNYHQLYRHIASPPLHSKGHQGWVAVLVEVLPLLSLATTLTTASCSMPALMLVRSISSSVGMKAKPILRRGFHWKHDPPKPIQPTKPDLPWQKRSPSLLTIF